MKDELKRRVYEANMLLPKYGLITFTWGNVSEREGDVVAIKPSGVEYDALRPEDIVLVGMDGSILEDGLNPSSDLETHLELKEERGLPIHIRNGRLRGRRRGWTFPRRERRMRIIFTGTCRARVDLRRAKYAGRMSLIPAR